MSNSVCSDYNVFEQTSVLAITRFPYDIDCQKAVGDIPTFLAHVFKLIKGHVGPYEIVVYTFRIMFILFEYTQHVYIIPNHLHVHTSITLTEINTRYLFVTSPNKIVFDFALLLQQTIVKHYQRFLFTFVH